MLMETSQVCEPAPHPLAKDASPPGAKPAFCRFPSALLERFYSRAGLEPPRLRVVRGDEVPQPYKGLLVHSTDMTPTLEGFHGQAIQLAVLSSERQGDVYWREVILRGADDSRPVEYGVIRICLAPLSPAAARSVLEERRPLGKILQAEAVAHLSWPQAFFRVESDARLRKLLDLRQPATLYGRRNVLADGSRRLLAEVIEILPPWP
jgi:chorismate-pyruvate lyase